MTRAGIPTLALGALAVGGVRPLLGWAARRTLVGRSRSSRSPERGRFTRRDVNRLMAQGWRNFDELAPRLPHEATVGARMNVALAAVSAGFHRALVSDGIERDEATSLVADVAWRIYQRWGAVAFALARVSARHPLDRLRASVRVFLRFPFSAPGYRVEHLPDRSLVALDVRRCPVAEYLGGLGLADLCVGAWCNQDYALAERWGGRLVRTTTLASGGARCDFRFETRGETIE